MAQGSQVIDILTKEMERRVQQGNGVVEKGAPAVAFLSSSLSDPAVAKMFEECGLAMRGPLIYYMPPLQRAESRFTTFEERTVEAMMRRGIYHSTPGCIGVTEESIKAMKVDGLISYHQFSCRASSPQGLIIKRSIENDLGYLCSCLKATVSMRGSIALKR